MVHFIGAGCGAADLITVRGARLLSEADVIIWAGSLVNPALLSYAKEDAEIHDSAHMTLEDVLSVIEKAEAEGKTTARLHTGDPSLYGAVREQFDALDAHGIAYDVCPGVSAFSGAASALRCEFTLPEVCQTLIITRAQGRTPVPDRERLRELARHRAAMALYLSAGLAQEVADEMIAGGYPAETPVAVVYKATWPDERILRCTVGTLDETMAQSGIDRTALIVVGDCLGDCPARSKLYDPGFSTGFREAKP